MAYLITDKSPGRKLPINFSVFPDGDIHCIIPGADALGDKILLYHDLYPDQNIKIIQLLLILDGLVQIGVKDIKVFVPYLPYSRQDKSYAKGEVISANTICHLLQASGCSELFTIDCHFMKGIKEQRIRSLIIHNKLVTKELLEACRKKIGNDNFEIIGPDTGSSYLTSSYGSKNMIKKRGHYGNLSQKVIYRNIIEIKDEHINLAHRTVVLIDDMISTGSTILKAIEALRKRGVDKVYIVATHGLFLGNSASRIESVTRGIIVSDTIKNSHAIEIVDKVIKEYVIDEVFKY